jgi:transposase
MALGKRAGVGQAMWVATADLPQSPGHAFYEQLNLILEAAGFDRYVEERCAPYYAAGIGRPGIAPGIFFRMMLVGYFENLESQREIVWRCADSLSLRAFLGLGVIEPVPDQSSLTRIRQRLPQVVYEEVFEWLLSLLREQGLLDGQSVGVDSTTLEANAAMRTIVRRDTGDDWRGYVRGLAEEEGVEVETEEELRRYDRQREGKRVSNAEWVSPVDPDSRITKMKDGTTHLGYKAEHVVDLDTEVLLGVQVYPGDQSDSRTLLSSMAGAQEHLVESGGGEVIEKVVGDKGYFSVANVLGLTELEVCGYLKEPFRPQGYRWRNKPEGAQAAVYENRRRGRGAHGRGLQRRRSAVVERSFAHVCETGGGRRTWLRGLVNVNKRYLLEAVGYNLSVLMRKLLGYGKPRAWAAQAAAALFSAILVLWCTIARLRATGTARFGILKSGWHSLWKSTLDRFQNLVAPLKLRIAGFSTGS